MVQKVPDSLHIASSTFEDLHNSDQTQEISIGEILLIKLQTLFECHLFFPQCIFFPLFQDLIQYPTFHLVVTYFLSRLLQSVTVPLFFLFFHDLDTCDEYWSIILYNFSHFGFVMFFI